MEGMSLGGVASDWYCACYSNPPCNRRPRHTHTSPRRGRLEEFIELNPSNPLQSEEPGIGNDSFYAASAVSPNVNHQDKTSSLFTIDRIAKPLPNAAQTFEDPNFEEPESQQPFCDCITQVWHQHICLYARQLEGYSDEAHHSAVMAAI
jgi:hypothetical protein